MKPTFIALLALCLCVVGCGTPKIELEATKASAEAGDARAQNNLGWMYESGQGVERDFKEAVKGYQKAADQGNAVGQKYIGEMYGMGKGVKQDYAEALKWYQKAAGQGDAKAQHTLGAMYANGQGVPKDDEAAYAWCNIAVANGNPLAKKYKGRIAEKMTPAQITKAQELIRQMVIKNPKLLK